MTAKTLKRFNRGVQKLDRVAIAIALIILLLATLVPAQVSDTLRFTLVNLVWVTPFLLLSVAIATYAQATGADNLISKAFQGRMPVMISVASLFGAVSPFCSCGVITLIAALLSMGVPVAPVIAFWLSSPLMDPAMFVLSVGTLGLPFTIAKTIATVLIGLLGGFGILALMRLGVANAAFTYPLREGAGNGGCGGSRVRKPKPVRWRFWA
ncbi:MAG: permease, partial [Cyanobacteria bacterium P01_D01_bin.128]